MYFGFLNDEILDLEIDLIFGLAKDLIPFKGVHSTKEGLSVDGEIFIVGQDQLPGNLGSNSNKAVYVCHRVKSDTVLLHFLRLPF